MTDVRIVRDYLPPHEVARLRAELDEHVDRFAHVSTKAAMNLPYRVVNGLDVRRHLPELAALAAGPLLAIAQELAGEPLELMRDDKRNLRVHWYRGKQEGFRWHLDGGLYGALLTLTNENDGGTETLTRRQSRWLRPIPYLLYPFPRILELAGPQPIPAGAGDLVVLRGGDLIHRGVGRGDGDRILVAASYDPIGRVRSKLWDRVARWLNY